MPTEKLAHCPAITVSPGDCIAIDGACPNAANGRNALTRRKSLVPTARDRAFRQFISLQTGAIFILGSTPGVRKAETFAGDYTMRPNPNDKRHNHLNQDNGGLPCKMLSAQRAKCMKRGPLKNTNLHVSHRMFSSPVASRSSQRSLIGAS